MLLTHFFNENPVFRRKELIAWKAQFVKSSPECIRAQLRRHIKAGRLMRISKHLTLNVS